MTSPLHIWRGSTTHIRLKPFEHRFRYPVAMIGIDLDRLEDAEQAGMWFGVNRPALFSFHEKDFGARDGSGVKHWSRSQFQAAGISGIEHVILICQPRIMGYQFNPISLHFGYDSRGVLRGIIYEVHNTFGEAHAYVTPVAANPVEHHRADKAFHVSPFFDVSGQYEFALQPPADALSLAIRKIAEDGPDFRASMSLRRTPATSKGFLGWFASFPFSTLFTIALIHFEALRLWLKGARYHKRPSPPVKASTPVLETRPQKQ